MGGIEKNCFLRLPSSPRSFSRPESVCYYGIPPIDVIYKLAGGSRKERKRLQ